MTAWHPERIGEDVRRELARFGPAGAMGEIVAAWPDAVGPAIAANAWPARVARDGTLHVAARSSVWAFELTQLEGQVRERLSAALGSEAPPRLRYAVGRVPDRHEAVEDRAEGETSPNTGPSSATEMELAAGREIAASIENDELRSLVAKAAAASLALARGRAAGRPLW